MSLKPSDKPASAPAAKATEGPPSRDLDGPASRESTIEISEDEISVQSLRLAGISTPPVLSRSTLMPLASLPTVERSAYVIGKVVAQGGIGEIRAARDTRLGRTVAIKQLLSTEHVEVERFVREAIITSRLQHPAIVPVHEAGFWPTGEPFIAMKLVSGKPLLEVMKAAETLDQRFALLLHILAVADAMAYAHSQRIIHRDLKPANILVGEFGETVVIDWGLAKDLADEPPNDAPEEPTTEEVRASLSGASEGRSAQLTSVGLIMGTPAYMPLEQASARPVDERADVYAIGALLYRALAGVAPYEGANLAQVALKVLAGPPTPLGERQKGIPEDLLAIVAKAMARDKAQRYPTAMELADDLRRFQTGQIVGAHQYTRADLVRRFAKQRRAPLLVALAGLIVCAVLGVVSVRRILDERNRAQASEREAQQQKAAALAQRVEAQEKQAEATRRADDLTLSQARGLMDRDPSQAVAWLKTLSPKSPRWAAARTLAADALSHGVGRVFRGHEGGINTVTFAPDGRSLATASDDRTVRLWDLGAGTQKVLDGHDDEVWCAAFSPDGKLLATGGKDKALRVWDVASGKSRVFMGHEQWITSAQFSPDGKWIASQGLGEGLFLWEVAAGAGRRIAVNASNEMRRGPVFSADGRKLVFVEKGKLVVWDLATATSRTFSGQVSMCSSIAISADGMLVVTGGVDGTAELWSASKGLVSRIPDHKKEITALAFLRNGSAFISGSKDRFLHVVDVSNGAVRVLGQYGGEIKAIELSPDGSQVAAVGQDRSVMLWNVATGQRRVFGGFQDWLAFHGVAFSPDGARIAAAGFDQTMRVWELGAQIDRVIGEYDGAATTLAFLPDGERAVSASADGTIRLFDLASGAPRALTKHDGKVNDLWVFPDGGAVATAGEDGTVRVSPISGAEAKVFRGHLGRVARIAVSPSGKLVASGGEDKKVRLWDVATGTADVIIDYEKPVEALVFSPDGDLLAVGSAENDVRLYRISSREVKPLGRFERPVRALAFSPDGKTLAAGSVDHTIRLWDITSGKSQTIDASGNGVTRIVFFPDGATFASLGAEPSVRLWDTATGKPRGVLRGHGKSVESLSISSDGRRIASASLDGTVRIWDLDSHEDRTLTGHVGGVSAVVFARDGRSLISAGQDGTVRLWGDNLPSDEAGLRSWLDAATKDVVNLEEPAGLRNGQVH